MTRPKCGRLKGRWVIRGWLLISVSLVSLSGSAVVPEGSRLDSTLSQLLSESRSHETPPGTSPRELAQGQVRVVLELVLGSTLAERSLQALGANLELSIGSRIQVLVPITSVTALSRLSQVRFVRAPVAFEVDQGETVTEGLKVIGAPAWHKAGFAGQGIRIGVLDVGFASYQRLLGSELPEHVTARSFRANGDLEAYVTHGTAVAEIIHDVAPRAELYLANISTDIELAAAVDWLIQQRVQVVSHSISWLTGCYEGPGALIHPLVAKARENGIAWVNSAGNRAQQHWQGTTVDENGDGWLEFAPGDDSQSIQGRAGANLRIQLTWDDHCEGTLNDYDLYVFDDTGTVVGQSATRQNGSPIPSEFLSIRLRTNGTHHIKVKRERSVRPGFVQLFCLSCRQSDAVSDDISFLEYRVPAGSLVEPALSPAAIVVGAAFWQDEEVLDYSSQGPTRDGRTKPDITAPTSVSVSPLTFGSWSPSIPMSGLTGTSAAAPHVAGAVALIRQAFPHFGPEEIRNFLQERAEDLGEPGLDNQSGAGRLDLGAPPANARCAAMSADEACISNEW